MTEKEKRASGLLYDANHNPEIEAELLACKDLCFQYNQILPSHMKERTALLKKLLGKTGENLVINAPFWCDFGYNIQVGENFYANHGCVILDGGKVTFGDNVFIAPDCGFYTAGHPLDAEQRNLGLEYAWPITVGDNVWIGANVMVLPGVTIGSDTVIAAGSVVNRDIPSGVVAVGNPCRMVRAITEADREKYSKGPIHHN